DKRDGYYGIGADVGTDAGGSMIARVKAGGPADRAGLVPGDRILAVDGHAVDGLRPHAVARRLHGTPHSRVALKVVAAADGEAPRDLTLVRDLIVPETVHAKRVGRVLVLTIDSFNQETAESLALALIAALDGPVPPRSLILDLRGNPGGLLREAVAVADEFLTQGTIIATRGRHPDSYQFYDADAVALAAGLPMAVLVDGRSASAAEVVAAALQDRGRAVVVGTRSFGKGTVQTVIGLPNDGEITLTWSRLQAPSGYLLHGLGVMPTVCVGADDPSADATISRALAHRAATGATLAAWRTGPADAAERRRLRAQCPPVTAKDDRSLAVALHLLRHPRTHRRALSLADQVTAAR
ncbi:MAG: PDZ domain-containing protein, partial [Rhodobacterales bacterium]|nr:PDZ domain-containing protein [Rhodobacterales bacterium]